MIPLLIDREEVCKLVGLSRTTIYRMIGSGDFPNRVQIGSKRVAWRYADILSWVEGRSAA